MKKVIKISESQFVGLMNLMEEQVKIIRNEDDLPKIVSELQKIVTEGKDKVRTILNLLLDKSQRDIIENYGTYVNYLEKLKVVENEYTNKHTKYYDIMDKFYYDNMNGILSDDSYVYYKQADKLVDELDNIQTDISTLVDNFEEMVNLFNPEKIEYFFKQYPEKNIEI